MSDYRYMSSKEIRKGTIKTIVQLVLVVVLTILALRALPTEGNAKSIQEPVAPIEANYKPGIASSVEYDYIKIDGVTYIIFRDKYTNSIAVYLKYW